MRGMLLDDDDDDGDVGSEGDCVCESGDDDRIDEESISLNA
jgi:hypothetical protein